MLCQEIYIFVALARTLGIPSRVDAVTGKPQWGTDNAGGITWHDASFTSDVQPSAQPQGKLNLSYEPMEHITDARYYTHFTLHVLTTCSAVVEL